MTDIMQPHLGRLGWIPDRPDPRDIPYRDLRPRRCGLRAMGRPSDVDLRATGLLPPVYNQGALGSCSFNAGAGLAAFVEAKEGHPGVLLSRLAWYYDVRLGYGQVPMDTGAQIRDLFISLKRTGCCLETGWPYDLTHWTDRPPLTALHEGYHRHRDLLYTRLSGIDDILDCVAQGWPVVFGATLFPEFGYLSGDFVLPMPGPGAQPSGGHAMLIVGYSMARRAVLVRNSWGEQWGLGGHLWIQFVYLESWAWDFWTLRKINP